MQNVGKYLWWSSSLIYLNKTLTLSMVVFKYLGNILQYSSLNGYFHEDSEKKTADQGYYVGFPI